VASNRQRRFDPRRDRKGAVAAVLDARARGAKLRQAAAAGGIDVGTVCRWAARSPRFQEDLDAARDGARERARLAAMTFEQRHADLIFRLTGERLRVRQRPTVDQHPACPCCGSAVEVRTSRRRRRFWRCSRWPRCGWASWRPRHPEDCPSCGGVRYWSHSRKSVGCPGCGRRWDARDLDRVGKGVGGEGAGTC
jgi:hypothetical protein